MFYSKGEIQIGQLSWPQFPSTTCFFECKTCQGSPGLLPQNSEKGQGHTWARICYRMQYAEWASQTDSPLLTSAAVYPSFLQGARLLHCAVVRACGVSRHFPSHSSQLSASVKSFYSRNLLGVFSDSPYDPTQRHRKF